MRAKRCVLAALLMALLTLTGCGNSPLVPISSDEGVTLPPSTYQPPAAPTTDSRSERSGRVLLYFVSSDLQQLTGVHYTVRAASGQTLEEAAVDRLFSATPAPGLLSAAPEGTKLKNLEISQGIATVDLSLEALTAQPQEILRLMAALTATLTGFEQIQWVNVLINGSAPAVYRLPMGALSAGEGNLTALVAQQQSDSERYGADPASAQIERMAVLYFPAWQQDLYLPELRKIPLRRENPAADLLEALRAGPADGSLTSACLPGDVEITRAKSEIHQDGRTILEIDFAAGFAQALERDGIGLRQALSALSLTCMRFMPQLDGIVVSEEGATIRSVSDAQGRVSFRQGIVAADTFAAPVGQTVSLYFASSEQTLQATARAMDIADAVSPRALMRALIEGPGAFEGGTAGVVPDGVAEDDILGIRQEGSLLLLNLSGNFYRLCQTLGEARERLLVYAIVNTMAQLRDVERVLFYFEGETADTLSGWIYLREPLIPNPGLSGNG